MIAKPFAARLSKPIVPMVHGIWANDSQDFRFWFQLRGQWRSWPTDGASLPGA